MNNFANKRRLKLLVMIGISLSALIVTMLIASRLILLDSFLEIEQSNMRQNIEQVLNALNGEVKHIDTINSDYSAWDDSYQFLQDGNSTYINESLPDSVLSTLRLNVIIFIRNNGDIVYKRWSDPNSEVSGNVPESLLSHLQPERPLVKHSVIDSTAQGILRLPEGLILISSRPVLTNDHLGPIHGALIMGRFLDSKEIELLAQQTKLSMKISENELYVAASIGISLFPSDGENADHLLMKADTAMYHCKAQGGNNYKFFAEEMNLKAKDRLSMETNLRKALEQQEFVLYYQPKVNLSTGEICGMEALIRWQRDGRMISPAEFIPLAEETGVIIPIGEWVLRTACRDMKQLVDTGYTSLVISSNLSSRQFCNDNLVELIGSILDETGLDPAYFELELTESILMKDEERLIRKLFAIKDRGIRLSIDVLKIDRSFVMDITTNPDGAAIVETILAMTHTLKLRSVAEGVEKLEELMFLAEHGCEEMQGFYFSRPVPLNAFTELLSSGKRLQTRAIFS